MHVRFIVNVGKYSIHGSIGSSIAIHYPWISWASSPRPSLQLSQPRSHVLDTWRIRKTPDGLEWKGKGTVKGNLTFFSVLRCHAEILLFTSWELHHCESTVDFEASSLLSSWSSLKQRRFFKIDPFPYNSLSSLKHSLFFSSRLS